MISKDQIRSTLLQVAVNNNLVGESVNLLVDELAYSLYHSQIEVMNAVQESNLSTAKLLNSKIRSCMNVMYSVFRGRNARVKLNFQNNTQIKKSKFDVIYTSNTFKVYAEKAEDLSPSVDQGSTGYNKYTLIGILANKDLYESEVEVTLSKQYYIDMIIDREVISNLSEDVQILINGVEYPTTRNFYDHIQQALPLKNNDAYLIGDKYYYVKGVDWIEIPESDPLVKSLKIKGELVSKTQLPSLPSENLDSIFVLTIPDYGIRLFKRGYFNTSDKVTIRALKYTTVNEINSDEFSKITIPGTILTGPLDISNEVKRSSQLDPEGNPTYLDNGIIREITRDDEKSLLYNANLYERLQATILSKSDINALFSEYFIEQVRSAINWYDDKGQDNFNEGTVYIFYVPKIDKDYILDSQMDDFKNKYGSYFISKNLTSVIGQLLLIDVQVTLYLSDSNELSTDIENIFNNYSNQLNDPNNWDNNVLKPKQIFAEISKLSTVDYIDELLYEQYTNPSGIKESLLDGESQLLPPTYIEDSDLGIKVPTYYKFNINITYKSSYENIS